MSRQLEFISRTIPATTRSFRLHSLGNPKLRIQCEDFTHTNDMKPYLDSLEHTLRRHKMFAVCGPQVGWNQKVFAMEVFDENSIREITPSENEEESVYGQEQDLKDLFDYWGDELNKAREQFGSETTPSEVEEIDDDRPSPILLVSNPTWQPASNDLNWFYETCGTAPNLRIKLARYNTIRVEFVDRFGEIRRAFIHGPDARVFQQQCGNLEGKWIFREETFDHICFDHEVARRQHDAEERIQKLLEKLSPEEQQTITDSFDLACPLTEEDMAEGLEQFLKLKERSENGLNGFADSVEYNDYQSELTEIQKKIDEHVSQDMPESEIRDILDDIFINHWTDKLRKQRENMDI